MAQEDPFVYPSIAQGGKSAGSDHKQGSRLTNHQHSHWTAPSMADSDMILSLRQGILHPVLSQQCPTEQITELRVTRTHAGMYGTRVGQLGSQAVLLSILEPSSSCFPPNWKVNSPKMQRRRFLFPHIPTSTGFSIPLGTCHSQVAELRSHRRFDEHLTDA